MIIDKSVGVWIKNASLLENIAYMLYLQDYNKHHEQYDKILTQAFVIYLYKDSDKYFEAATIIIRKDKLDKLNEL